MDRDMILIWLAEEGLEAKVEPVPPGVAIEWAVSTFIPGPQRIGMMVQKPSGNRKYLVVSIGIMMSPEHREDVMKMSQQERALLFGQILRDVLMLCPDCSVALFPSLDDVQTINVASFIHEDNLSRESLMRSIRVLANVFMLIVAEINLALIAKGIQRRPRPEGMTM